LTTNPVFEQFPSRSKEYKSELAKQIKNIGLSNLQYWYETAYERDGKYYAIIYIQGSGLCAEGELFIPDRNKFTAFRPMSGYRGAELKGVVIKTEQDSAGIDLVLISVDRIID